MIENQRGRFAEAIPHFEWAIQLAPGYDVARLGLSAAQSRIGQLAALRTLQSALRLTPRPHPAALSVGNCFPGLSADELRVFQANLRRAGLP